GAGALSRLAWLGLVIVTACHFGLLADDAGSARVRAAVAFAFGLIHGFGFASVLMELGLGDAIVSGLFGFNAGVELGQAAVVLVAVPALGLVRRAGWERRMVWALSAAILVVGLALFVERALL
ncbi:MAG TPA: HupE/UreJ family protein, partial [Methylomirabilota bacterium]|nr:HupE/UreJ family protein [Methylomirabilota bacterium]